MPRRVAIFASRIRYCVTPSQEKNVSSVGQKLERARAEAIAALTASTHGLQLDLAGEELQEHLVRLRGMVAEERGHIADLFAQAALEVRGIQAYNPRHLLELRQLGLERGLPRLLGTETALDIASGKRAIRQGVD